MSAGGSSRARREPGRRSAPIRADRAGQRDDRACGNALTSAIAAAMPPRISSTGGAASGMGGGAGCTSTGGRGAAQRPGAARQPPQRARRSVPWPASSPRGTWPPRAPRGRPPSATAHACRVVPPPRPSPHPPRTPPATRAGRSLVRGRSSRSWATYPAFNPAWSRNRICSLYQRLPAPAGNVGPRASR